LSAGAPPQTPLGKLTALPRPSSWNLGGLLLREGRGGEGRGAPALSLHPSHYIPDKGVVSTAL